MKKIIFLASLLTVLGGCVELQQVLNQTTQPSQAQNIAFSYPLIEKFSETTDPEAILATDGGWKMNPSDRPVDMQFGGNIIHYTRFYGKKYALEPSKWEQIYWWDDFEDPDKNYGLYLGVLTQNAAGQADSIYFIFPDVIDLGNIYLGEENLQNFHFIFGLSPADIRIERLNTYCDDGYKRSIEIYRLELRNGKTLWLLGDSGSGGRGVETIFSIVREKPACKTFIGHEVMKSKKRTKPLADYSPQ